jgi:hypothetical protein
MQIFKHGAVVQSAFSEDGRTGFEIAVSVVRIYPVPLLILSSVKEWIDGFKDDLVNQHLK